MQCFGWTDFSCIHNIKMHSVPFFSLTGFFIDFNIHGANFQAFAAMDAFIFIAMDTQKRKIAHWLEKHSNRAQIFAECAIIFKYKSQHNTYNIVKCISSKENPEHDSLQIRDFHQKQAENTARDNTNITYRRTPNFSFRGFFGCL